MVNLAGKPTAEIDRQIRRELERCGIKVVEGNPISHPEVKATVRGALGNLKLTRHWYYWGVAGPVPLEIAKRLYEDPVGRTDIRVNGHCGCPSPGTPGGMPEWIDADGRVLIPESSRPDYMAVFKGQDVDALVAEHNQRFSADREVEGRPFITCYHIDSELGLYIFARALRAEAQKEQTNA